MTKEYRNTVTIDGVTYDALMVEIYLNDWSVRELYVDYGSVLSRIEMSDHHINVEKFGESRIDLINRFLGV